MNKVFKGIIKDKFEVIYYKIICLKEFLRVVIFNVLNIIFKINFCVFLYYSVIFLYRLVVKML